MNIHFNEHPKIKKEEEDYECFCKFKEIVSLKVLKLSVSSRGP
jgi:hypothetical protein